MAYLSPPNADNITLTRISSWANSPNGPVAYFKGRISGTFYFVRYYPFGSFVRTIELRLGFLKSARGINYYRERWTDEERLAEIAYFEALRDNPELSRYQAYWWEFVDNAIIISVRESVPEIGQKPVAYVLFVSTSGLRSSLALSGMSFLNAISPNSFSMHNESACGKPFDTKWVMEGVDVPSLFQEAYGGERADYIDYDLVYGGEYGQINIFRNFKQHIVLDGIVSGWKFNSRTYGAIVDSYGTNNGVLLPFPAEGYEIALGVVDQALYRKDDMPGQSGVLISGPVDLDFEDNSFSISGWIKTTSPFVSIYKLCSSSTDRVHLYMKDGRIVFYVIFGGSSYTLCSTDSKDIFNDDQWHHVAVVVEREENSTNVYLCVDGEEIAGAEGIPVGSIPSADVLYLSKCDGTGIVLDESIVKGDFDFESGEELSAFWTNDGWSDEEGGPEATVDIGEVKTLSQGVEVRQGYTYHVQAEIEMEEWNSGDGEYQLDVYLGSNLLVSLNKDTEVDSSGIYYLDVFVVLGTAMEQDENLRFVLTNLEFETEDELEDELEE